LQTVDQRRIYIAVSGRAIAGVLGVDHKTVGRARIELEAGWGIPHHDNIVGIDGVSQPKRKKPIRTVYIDDTPEGQNTKHP